MVDLKLKILNLSEKVDQFKIQCTLYYLVVRYFNVSSNQAV